MADTPTTAEGELVFATVPASEIRAVSDPVPPSIIIQGAGGRPLVTIRPDGTLELGEGYDPDEAARLFWDALRTHMPARYALDIGEGEAEAKVAAVRVLHRPVTDRTGWDGSGGYDEVSPACTACGSEDNAVAYPCPTVRALDGEGN